MTPCAGLPVFYPRQHTVEDNAADPTLRLKIKFNFIHTNLGQQYLLIMEKQNN